LNTSTNFPGNIVFNVGIIKVGTGRLSLDGVTMTYTGITTVSNGILSFANAAPLTSTTYNLAKPGILDLSNFGTLTVGGGTVQTIQGDGFLGASLALGGNGIANPGFTNKIGTLTVSNDVNLGGTINMELNRTNAVGGTNDQISSATMTLGGTLNVTNIGSVLQVGDTFKLFKTTGAFTGTFSTVTIATTDASGAIYTWTDNTAVDGTIKVLSVTVPSVIVPTVSPAITNFSLSSGTNIVMNGTNGQAGATYYLLTSTNVISPINQWKTIATNVATGDGYSFTGTNAVNPALGKQFYILSSTNFNP